MFQYLFAHSSGKLLGGWPMILIDDIFFIGFISLFIGSTVAFVGKKRPFSILFWGICYVYLIAVLGLTLFPIPYQAVDFFYPVPHNLIPFRSIQAILANGITSTALVQIGGNILISVPYGILLAILLTPRNTPRKIGIFILLPLLFPLVIESLQFFIGLLIGLSYRSFDVDDFLLNALGGYFGLVVSALFFSTYCNRIHGVLFSKTTQRKV